MISKHKLSFLIVLDIVISIILIPIIGRYRGVETLSWIMSIICVLLGLYIIYYVISKQKERKYLIALPIVLIFMVILSYWLYEPIKSHIITAGLEHYEIEYYSFDPVDYPNEDNYDWMIEKYRKPVITTFGELKNEVSFEQPDIPSVSIKPTIIHLDDNTRVWVLATVAEDHIVDSLVFIYDKLNVSPDNIVVSTHFKTLRHYASSASKSDIIVLSIIPADQ